MLAITQLSQIYNNEQVLIVLLARLYLGTCTHAEVAGYITDNQINWQRVLKLAQVHGISSFIYSVLNAHGIAAPPALTERLKKRYLLTKMRNFEQIKAAAELTGHFAAQGITLIPYKGALFAEAYYTDWAARESIDLDFLVAPQNVQPIEDYFISNGYRKITGVPRPFLNYYMRFFKDLVYAKPGKPISIEIHWRLMERFSGNYPAFDFFSAGLKPYQTGSFSFTKLNPAYDFLALVSNHFVKDMSIKFKYLIDVAAIIKKEQAVLNSELIWTCAQTYKFEKRLVVGLQLTSELLGISFEQMPPQTLEPALLQTPLANKMHLNRLYINEISFIKRSLKLQDNFAEKLKFLSRCLAYAFLPTYADINELKLPAYLLPLMIVIRPFRLLGKAFNKQKSS